ncbi:MAG: SAM-dependent methyltransferase [Salibacteraceae bacterium]|jgi:SAM-dependent methyltransferase
MTNMTKIDEYSEFPDIQKYSNQEGISPSILVEAFAIEAYYHKILISEKSPEIRNSIYSEFYTKLMKAYGRDSVNISEVNPKDKYVRLFEKELRGKSIIDFGCGQGHMLQAISNTLGNEKLAGVDVVIPKELKQLKGIDFKEGNIINYSSIDKYQVAISDNVIEHLVVEDAFAHMSSIYEALEDGGKLIIMMPNRLFGPADVTRIKDFSHSGRVEAEGGHVNESTYFEMIHQLKTIGFTKFQTILPVPKLKFSLLKNIRVLTEWIQRIERSPFLLSIFRSIKIKGVCPIRFSITLIATK